MRARTLPALLAAFLLAAAVGPAVAQDDAGKAVYTKWCAGCHGVDGKGDGPAADRMMPRPRDFVKGLYQIRTTPSGAFPTDADLMRVVENGMPGTAMPAWKKTLGESDRRAVIEVVKSFAPAFAERGAPEPLAIGKPPKRTDEGLAEGREFYEKIECFKCHGQAGRGDGPSARTLKDKEDRPVRARDLTMNWLFNGGGSVEEIYTRLLTGLNGTPMPANQDLVTSGFMTEEQLWHVAQYVRSLSPEEPPEAAELIHAGLAGGAMPKGVDDPVWDDVEPAWVPLVGQVVQDPRWFAPRVEGVWVQALHDGKTLALRLSWDDPSKSPDPDWAEWRDRVTAMMGGAAPADSAAGTDSVAPAAAPAPDRLVLQFPREIPEGMERPYFLMGSEKDPVYLWVWESDREAAREAIGRGLGSWSDLDGGGDLPTDAAFQDGRWRLQLSRPLDAGDVEDRLAFETGRAVPMALFAWDGDNGETGKRGAIGTWYFLVLDRPTAARVYVIPVVATLLTAALGLAVVARARRRSDGSES